MYEILSACAPVDEFPNLTEADSPIGIVRNILPVLISFSFGLVITTCLSEGLLTESVIWYGLLKVPVVLTQPDELKFVKSIQFCPITITFNNKKKTKNK